MPMQIIRNDIIHVSADAIVNSANYFPTYAPGVDKRIYLAAGERELLQEREKVGILEVGDACVTPAFKLPAKYIIHVSSPIWEDGEHNETKLLKQCYDKVLSLAFEYNCESIAIPLLATGNFCFPQGVGLEVAISAIREFLDKHDMLITLVVYNTESFTLAQELTDEVTAYIDENYIEEHEHYSKRFREYNYIETQKNSTFEDSAGVCFSLANDYSLFSNKKKSAPRRVKKVKNPEETEELREIMSCECDMSIPGDISSFQDLEDLEDKPFSSHIFALMNKKGIEKSSDVYKACNMTKQTWSKMMKPDYTPSKNTVMQLCIGLKLNIDEARDLMLFAGFAFSPNKKFDVLVEFCIKNQKDILQTEAILFEKTERTLSNYA